MIGIFITLEEPTAPMGQKAIGAGFDEPESLPGNRYPKVQILAIEQLLDGAQQALRQPGTIEQEQESDCRRRPRVFPRRRPTGNFPPDH